MNCTMSISPLNLMPYNSTWTWLMLGASRTVGLYRLINMPAASYKNILDSDQNTKISTKFGIG